MANTRDGHGFALTVVALGLTLLTAACSSGKGGASFAGNVDPKPPASSPDTEITTSTTGLNPAELVLSADGLGPLRFGTQAAQALSGLTQAFGRAAPPTRITDAACGATRIFKWNNLAVLVNETSGRFGTPAGLVGWSLGAEAPSPLGLKTDKGIGIGSTVKALKAAYGNSVAIASADKGPAFRITTASGVVAGELDALGDAGKVRSLQAGTVCGF
jgi:hypothetical protein